MSWVGIGRVLFDAYDAIAKVKVVTDAVMSALPKGKATDRGVNQRARQIVGARVAMKVKYHQSDKQAAMPKRH